MFNINAKKFGIAFQALRGLYGGVRGWSFYNTEYELETKYYEKNKVYNILSKNAPTHYYITQSFYTLIGAGYYILPITFFFASFNEIYRAETILRKLECNEKKEFYYNPFYPFYFISYKY